MPEIPAGKKLHLWGGATDGRIQVFVNGQPVPYISDNREFLNELGTGGLLALVAVFADK